MEEITPQYITLMAANQKNDVVEEQLIQQKRKRIFGKASLMFWTTMIGGPIAFVCFGAISLIPFVTGLMITTATAMYKAESVFKYASQSEIMDSLIMEYQRLMEFPSEDAFGAFVTGHFDELEEIVHVFNKEQKEKAPETKSEANMMYG